MYGGAKPCVLNSNLSPLAPSSLAQHVGGVGGDSFGSFAGGGGGGSNKTEASSGGGVGGRGGNGGREFSGRNGLRGWGLEPPDSVLAGFSALTGGDGGYHSGVLKHARSAGSLATAGEGSGEGLPRRASGIRQLAATAAAVEGPGNSSGGERQTRN